MNTGKVSHKDVACERILRSSNIVRVGGKSAKADQRIGPLESQWERAYFLGTARSFGRRDGEVSDQPDNACSWNGVQQLSGQENMAL